MTTQPEPRSVTEALDRLRERVFDAHGEADFVTVSVHDLLLALAATPGPAPAVVSHTPVQYDAGCVSHGMTTERHCAADGHPMPDSVVVPEWSGPSTEADDAEDHGDGYLIAPAVVPDVEAPWSRPLTEAGQRLSRVPLVDGDDAPLDLTADIIWIEAEARAPLLAEISQLRSAAIRAEGRGALDVARKAISDRYDDLRWCGKDDLCNVKAEGALLALQDFDYALAQREPAESQGCRHGRVVGTWCPGCPGDTAAPGPPAESQGPDGGRT